MSSEGVSSEAVIAQTVIDTGSARDLDAIMPVMQSAFDPIYGEAWSLAQCAGLLSLPGSWLLIARAGGIVAAFALARQIFDEAELLLIAVHRDQQRLGIGNALLSRVTSDAASRGVKRVHLEMRANNSANHFYNNRGFIACGLRKNYYRGKGGQLTDAVTLTKQIR